MTENPDLGVCPECGRRGVEVDVETTYQWPVPILTDQPMGRPVEADVRARCVYCGWEVTE
jgi:hypothetical protein